MKTPTVDAVREIDVDTARAMHHGWREVSRADIYLRARDALAASAGGSGTLLSDPTLQEIQEIVRGLNLGDYAYGTESSVRWAYLASLNPQALSAEQYDALTRGWRAAGN